MNYGAGDGPSSVAIDDLNGDAKQDLAVANEWSGNVSVLLGNGDGTFQDAVNYGAGDRPSSVAIDDLNGDANADLAVANWGSDSVSVLLNNGDGTFQDAVNYDTGDWPSSVAIGDLNGDANADLAVANWGHSVSVLLNNGDGTFQDAVNYSIYPPGPPDPVPRFVAIGDLNGDANPDLAVAIGSPIPDYVGGNVSVLLNNGDGTFQDAVNYGAGYGPISVTIDDLDGDAHLDLAVANYWGSGNVSVLLNNGDGTFQDAVNYGAGVGPSSVAIGDLNGDAHLDLAVANGRSDNVSILINEHVDLCEGDFDTDSDVDGSDLAVFAADFGRTDCSGDCEGDFDTDNDVDGSDLAVFAKDFGRTDCPTSD